MPKRIECKIYGRVQGVFFRDFVKTEADRLGLFGFVKNLEDGGVEIAAEGDENKLKEFLEILRRGTKYSKIGKIEVEEQNATGEFSDFEVRF